MNRRIIERVRQRAHGRCEYCHLPASRSPLPFQIDHIIAEQHGGDTTPRNLAWACLPCNKRKGPNLSGIDPRTRHVVLLFHPRRQRWERHFRWDGPFLRGRTQVGRATVVVLGINDAVYVQVRRELLREGVVF
jgi:hypothetical protein